jgi:hypothetical protein
MDVHGTFILVLEVQVPSENSGIIRRNPKSKMDVHGTSILVLEVQVPSENSGIIRRNPKSKIDILVLLKVVIS